jgi:chromosome segregation ATPase
MDTDSLLETGQLLQQEHVLHEQHSVKACEKKMRYLEERYDELQSQLGSHRQTIAEYEHSEQMIKGKLNSLETQLQDRETSAKG